MPTLSIDQVQARLPELIDQLRPGADVVITRGDRKVARLVGEVAPRRPRQAGNCRGMAAIVADDDEHLRDFAEHMP